MLSVVDLCTWLKVLSLRILVLRCVIFLILIEMNDKPIGRGYTVLEANNHPWAVNKKNIHAHEFHYSSVT